jgi:hypothetical protein
MMMVLEVDAWFPDAAGGFEGLARFFLCMGPAGHVEGGDAVVVELGGNGAEHRHLLRRLFKGIAVALHLLAHIAHGILAAAFFELVDHHEIGEIEHVDFSNWEAAPNSLVMT